MILRIAFKNLLHKPLYAVLCWLLLACSTAVLLSATTTMLIADLTCFLKRKKTVITA